MSWFKKYFQKHLLKYHDFISHNHFFFLLNRLVDISNSRLFKQASLLLPGPGRKQLKQKSDCEKKGVNKCETFLT